MSVDYTAYALIGQKLDKAKLYRTVSKPGCPHVTLPFPYKFCPACGALAVVTNKDMIEGFDGEKLFGLEVVSTTDQREMFAVMQIARTNTRGSDESEMVDVLSIPQLRMKAQEILEPHGLWNEKQFGMWSVLHCSY